jgi:hypothetical protein
LRGSLRGSLREIRMVAGGVLLQPPELPERVLSLAEGH